MYIRRFLYFFYEFASILYVCQLYEVNKFSLFPKLLIIINNNKNYMEQINFE